MNNSDMPAMPAESSGQDTGSPYYTPIPALGLTKREHFAIKVLQGLLSSSKISGASLEDRAKGAVMHADALLKELDNDR
jgi:hypothetical protein